MQMGTLGVIEFIETVCREYVAVADLVAEIVIILVGVVGWVVARVMLFIVETGIVATLVLLDE